MLRLVSFFDLGSLDSLSERLRDVSDSILRSNFWLRHSALKENWGWDKSTAKYQSFLVIENNFDCVGLAIVDDSEGIHGRVPWADLWTNVRPEHREETIQQMLDVCRGTGIKDARVACPIKKSYEDSDFAVTLETLGAHKLPGYDINGTKTFCFLLEPTTELPKEAPRGLIHTAN